MNEPTFFLLAFLAYVLSALVYFGSQLFCKDKWAKSGYALAGAGLAVHTLALAARTLRSGHAPFTNMYESISFLAWASALAYLLMEGKFKIRKTGPYVMLIIVALMAIASSPLMPKEATPLVPALQSYWLWLHVSMTLLGEAFFAVAFVSSLLFLHVDARGRKSKSDEEARAAERYDAMSYRAVAVGFPLFTLGGLVFGMIWAQKAWGTAWSWDPKEVWSLITWLVFALYLHTRTVMGWKGRRAALLVVLGFLAALFTYFGVNYLLSGLHSYA
jgi:cytochrome c-type biogenesis protein CcsB